MALRSPYVTTVVRLSPFDPTGRYFAALSREAAHTRQVPPLFAHHRLEGGGDLQIMEWLDTADRANVVVFHRSIANRDPALAQLGDIVRRVHTQARCELAWCGPLDESPSNVMRGAESRLVVADLLYAPV